VRGDRTHEFYQGVQVIHQGKCCRDSDNCKKRTFTPEVVARFIFQGIAGDVPKRLRGIAQLTSAESFECDGVIPVICYGHPVAFASYGNKQIAAVMIRSR
jgi:hypothetical protein